MKSSPINATKPPRSVSECFVQAMYRQEIISLHKTAVLQESAKTAEPSGERQKKASKSDVTKLFP